MGSSLQVCAGTLYYIEYIQVGDELNNGADNRLVCERGATVIRVVFDGQFYPGKEEVVVAGNNDKYYDWYEVKCPDSKYDDVKSWKVESITPTGTVDYVTSIGGTGMGPSYCVSLSPVWETPTPGTGDAGKDSGENAAPTSTDNALPHVHSFQWVITKEPTLEEDGLEQSVCSCGEVEQELIIPASEVYVKGLYGEIKNAEENGTVEYDAKKNTCISDYIIQKLAERSDVKTTITFTYKDAVYRFTIPEGTDFTALLTDEENFYGYFTFCKLLDIPVQAVEE